MPKIDAPSVAEHRAAVQERLVDAAEAILRDPDAPPLTAAAVTKAAGIARNSIYRYVETVDDLRMLVVRRHLPAWIEAVVAATDGLEPADRVVAWVKSNLRQAATTGHGWLMAAARTATESPGSPASPAMEEAVAQAHAGAQDPLPGAWAELLGDEERAAVAASLTIGLADAGFALLDRGVAPELVVEMGASAARALTRELPREGADPA